MTDDCSDLDSEAGSAGDTHYRAIGAWLRGGMAEHLRKKAHRAAVAYRRALKFLINCYRRARGSVGKRRRLNNAVALEALVAQDIEVLERHEPAQGTSPSS
jgi:hypothetical protein